VTNPLKTARGGLADWRADAQPVAIWVTEPDLRSPGHLLDGCAALPRDFLGESEALIPGGGSGGAADAKDRDDFLCHGLIVSLSLLKEGLANGAGDGLF